MSGSARIAALHVYPVKGCRPVSPAQVRVDTPGFSTAGAGDREWRVVDGDGRFITQREHPRLALIGIALTDGALTLAAPAQSPLSVPPAAARPAAREVVVWHSTVRGIDAGDAAAAWLTAWLGVAVRLIRFDRSLPRRCNPDYAGGSGAHTMFADGYPVLVIGSASLADLNARLEARGGWALPMNRFRPNLVLDDLEPYGEDHLDTIVAGDVVLRCVKPCVRCQVTTTDQATGDVGLEPLRTLGNYRMNERLGGVTFGINAIVEAGGTLATGAAAQYTYRF
jgi:uncharacterized protein YcbX